VRGGGKYPVTELADEATKARVRGTNGYRHRQVAHAFRSVPLQVAIAAGKIYTKIRCADVTTRRNGESSTMPNSSSDPINNQSSEVAATTGSLVQDFLKGSFRLVMMRAVCATVRLACSLERCGEASKRTENS